ncbi:MAG: beta-galactosidase [Bacteroidales bacterium]|nr:beta-galactosidase [Bacteroidales bacterium]MBN2698299.1 beta-galactosidase [Bacteroidales bacterium]
MFRTILTYLFITAILEIPAVAQTSFIEPETDIIYLSGTGSDNPVEWNFYCSSGMKSGSWTKINVPSCWEQQGFGTYNYGVYFYGKATDPAIPDEYGLYRYEFEVPADWKNRNNRIVFEGSMTDTEVRINGKSAGPVHQGGFYRFSYDITDLLEYSGSNLLEVTVRKESENASVNLAERRADYWNFGGIFRPVFIESRPEVNILRVAVDGKADGTFSADVFLGRPAGKRMNLELLITDHEGKRVGDIVLKKIKAGEEIITLSNSCRGINHWTAETPFLYTASFKLSRGETVLHRVTTRFGFRTMEIREGDGIYLNGQRILLKGVNRHSFRPESGRTLSPAQNREDVLLIKEMNMNTVRMSHYPPDPEFLDACDELGLYVLNELGGWHGKYNTEIGKKLVKELVTRDVNHPSVIFWDNGNEGGWNTELDSEFSKWDPQNRPVLHPQQELNGVETMHYRSYGETQEYLRGKEIFFPTEILHGLYDGGLGAGLYDYWEFMRNHPRCAGGLLWVFADEGIIRTDLDGKIDCDGNHGADGIVGPHHEREGSFYTIKEVWSPVQVLMEELPEEFNGIIPVENRYDFINLNRCTFKWTLGKFYGPSEEKNGYSVLDSGTALSPELPPHLSGELVLNLPLNWQDADVLYLTAYDPGGQELWTWSWLTGDPDPGQILNDGDYDGMNFYKDNGRLIVAADSLKLIFNLSDGFLEEAQQGPNRMSFGNGPRFIAFRRGDRTLDGTIKANVPKGVDRIYYDVAGASNLTGLEAKNNGNTIVVKADYSGPLTKAVWTIGSNGLVRLDYTYRYDGAVDLMGITFDTPEEKVQSLRWLGEGPYRVWANRLHGTIMNVWENQYNDPVPGESFEYPEFKGFFGKWKWAELYTEEGSVFISGEQFNNYLGIYTPRDGRDSLLYTFPEAGISVLDVIPPVRNKVNATDLIGPSSRVRFVEGIRNGTLYFRFKPE